MVVVTTAALARAGWTTDIRLALSVGNNVGLEGEEPLEYAEEDARRFHRLLVGIGGVDADRAYLLLNQTPDKQNRLVAEIFKPANARTRIAVQPAWYRIVLPGDTHAWAADVNLAWGGERLLTRADLVQVPLRRAVQRGGQPIVLRPWQLGVAYGLSSGSTDSVAIQHQGELRGRLNLGNWFVLAGLGFTKTSFDGENLWVNHLEFPLRIGAGRNFQLAPFGFSIGAQIDLALALQQILGMEPVKKCFLFGLVCFALVVSGCSDNGNGGEVCETNQDCEIGFMCVDGVCRAFGDGEPDGGDPGGDPSDSGAGDGDGGNVGTDLGPLWTITPGVGIGELTVSQTWTNYTTLGQVKSILQEIGTAVGSARYTLSFLLPEAGSKCWTSSRDILATVIKSWPCMYGHT